MAIARKLASLYYDNAKVAAVVVAGSVGRGLADRFSDLEMDVYWWRAPTDADRVAVIERAQGKVTYFWAYSEAEAEWGEEYLLDGLWVGISSFLVASIDRFIADVVGNADPSPLKQMRLSALREGVVLHGSEIVGRWRAASDRYPEALAEAIVSRHLSVEVLDGWHMRDALLDRGDYLFLHQLFVRLERAVLGALLGVNRIYLAHDAFKWQGQLARMMAIAPKNLERRLAEVFEVPAHQGVAVLQELLLETVDLIVANLRKLDMTTARNTLARRRPTLDPPPSRERIAQQTDTSP